MKKIYTVIAFTFLVAISKGQSIPNAGFENWTNYGTYSDPTSWGSFNSITAVDSFFTCEQGSPGAVGASFLKLTVKYNSNWDTIGGAIESNPTFIFGGPPVSSFACNLRPANLTGQLQYQCTGNDTLLTEVYLFKWDTITMTREWVAGGINFITAGSLSSWTNFSVPIIYYSNATPDSAYILFAAGLNNPVLNDYLYIDDLAFTGSVTGMSCLAYNSTSYDSIQNTFTITVDSISAAMATAYHWDFGDGTTSTLAAPNHIYAVDSLYNVCMKIYTASGDSCSYCHIIGKDSSGNIIRTTGFTLHVQNPNTSAGFIQNNADEKKIIVYPNPTNGNITIRGRGITTIEIYNAVGKNIYKQSNLKHLTSNEIDLSKSPKGIYFVKIYDGEKIYNRKIVVQ